LRKKRGNQLGYVTSIPSSLKITLSLSTPYKPTAPTTIAAQSAAGGTGAFVTSDKNGNGIVRAMYKLNSVILIRGESRNTVGSNMGFEGKGDSGGGTDIAQIMAGFIQRLSVIKKIYALNQPLQIRLRAGFVQKLFVKSKIWPCSIPVDRN
jgi:hypothetical protein